MLPTLLGLIAIILWGTTILSVWISSLYLGMSVTGIQWLASVLVVVVGAVGCKLSIRESCEPRP